jgi:hypothetical protein
MTLTFWARADRQRLDDAVRIITARTVFWFRLAGSLSLAAGLALIFVWMPLGVGACISAIMLLFFLPRSVLTKTAATLEAEIAKVWEYAFGPEGVRVRAETYESLWYWPAIAEVTELPGQLVLRLGPRGRQFVLVQTAHLTPEQDATLKAIIAARGSAPPPPAPDPAAVTVPAGRRLVTAAIKHQHRPLLTMMRRYGVLSVLLGTVVLARSGPWPAVPVLIGGVLLAIALYFALPAWQISALRATVVEPSAYLVDPDGITQYSAGGESRFRWQQVVGTEELPGQLLVTLESGFLCVPSSLRDMFLAVRP